MEPDWCSPRNDVMAGRGLGCHDDRGQAALHGLNRRAAAIFEWPHRRRAKRNRRTTTMALPRWDPDAARRRQWRRHKNRRRQVRRRSPSLAVGRWASVETCTAPLRSPSLVTQAPAGRPVSSGSSSSCNSSAFWVATSWNRKRLKAAAAAAAEKCTRHRHTHTH